MNGIIGFYYKDKELAEKKAKSKTKYVILKLKDGYLVVSELALKSLKVKEDN